jgi:hypothetical protein
VIGQLVLCGSEGVGALEPAGCRGGRGHLAQTKSSQRNPEGGAAVSFGTANENTGDAGGVVVVIVALSGPSVPDPEVPVLTYWLATTTPAVPLATTAPVPMAADSNLILFC